MKLPISKLQSILDNADTQGILNIKIESIDDNGRFTINGVGNQPQSIEFSGTVGSFNKKLLSYVEQYSSQPYKHDMSEIATKVTEIIAIVTNEAKKHILSKLDKVEVPPSFTLVELFEEVLSDDNIKYHAVMSKGTIHSEHRTITDIEGAKKELPDFNKYTDVILCLYEHCPDAITVYDTWNNFML